MKFNKSDIVKMGGTAVLTALLLLVIRPSVPQSEESAALVLRSSVSTSGAISWNTAQNYMNQWDSSAPLMTDDSSKPMTLKAFAFNARQLDTIINHNRNPNGKDSTADDVFVFFGQDSTFVKGKSKYVNVHLILVGGKYNAALQTDTLMINSRKASVVSASSVYDKADPCPPNCPRK